MLKHERIFHTYDRVHYALDVRNKYTSNDAIHCAYKSYRVCVCMDLFFIECVFFFFFFWNSNAKWEMEANVTKALFVYCLCAVWKHETYQRFIRCCLKATLFGMNVHMQIIHFIVFESWARQITTEKKKHTKSTHTPSTWIKPHSCLFSFCLQKIQQQQRTPLFCLPFSEELEWMSSKERNSRMEESLEGKKKRVCCTNIIQLTLRTVTESFFSACWMMCNASSCHFRPKNCSSVGFVEHFAQIKSNSDKFGPHWTSVGFINLRLLWNCSHGKLAAEFRISIAEKRAHKLWYELLPWWY